MNPLLTGLVGVILGALIGAGNVWHHIDEQINEQDGRLKTPSEEYQCITSAELEWMQGE